METPQQVCRHVVLFKFKDHLPDATVQEIRSDGVWMRLSRGGTQWLGLYAPAAEARQP